MSIARRLCGMVLCVLLASSATSAQTVSGRLGQDPIQITMITASDHVRFTTPGESLVWRLEVVNERVETVFDSGVITGKALDWPLVDPQGQAVESGLYNYTLTLRPPLTQDMRVQRGHLQIERVRSVYRISSVSSDTTDSGVALAVIDVSPAPVSGAELGAADHPGVPAAGAPAPEPIRRNTAGLIFTPAISGTGTTNAMTKWLDGPTGVLGDANVTEAAGAVVVGNGTFPGNLHIFGFEGGDVFAGMGPNVVTGPAFNYGYAGGSFGRSAGFFNVRPDAAATAPNPSLRFMTANVERMIVTNTGDVGIGITLPTRRLHVVSAGGKNGAIQVGSSDVWSAGERRVVGFGDAACGDACVYIAEEDADDRLVLKAGGFRFKDGHVLPETDAFQNLGDATHRWNTLFASNGTINTSDARLKREVRSLDDGLASLLKLRPVSFVWTSHAEDRRHLGLLAQEVEAVLPDVVFRDANPDVPLGINYTSLIPVVIKAIQDQQTVLRQKDAALRSLEAENAALRQRSDELDARLRAVEETLQRLARQGGGPDR